LDWQGLIEAAVGPELRHLRGRGVLAEHHLGRVAGDEAEEDEGRQGEDEQRRGKQRQPAEEIVDHRQPSDMTANLTD